MDFFRIVERTAKKGDVIEIYPDFKVTRSKDLMIRGKSFYAIWDSEAGLWSTDEYDVQRLVDKELDEYKKEVSKRTDSIVRVLYMSNFSSKSWLNFRNYVSHMSDSSHLLDENLTFSNSEVSKNDFVSKRLPYPLEEGSIEAFNELLETLYSSENREKLEWAIGSVIAGDSKNIQKFLVLYGEAGTGKSTILSIIQKLFVGYYTTFDAKALGSSSNSFSTETFKNNPLVAIQHDGDLSRIEDNTKLNSIISHEEMTMNEKFKPSYTARVNALLFVGTNKPVKITDAKSGLIRRLIDVQPTGRKLPPRQYQALMSQIDFELGAIANHCLGVYRKLGKDYYSGYRPVEMMLQTDVFFNFIESVYLIFKDQNGTSLSQAYDLYKVYCGDSNVEYKLPKHKFREELKSYFRKFSERERVNGTLVRSYYSEFITDKFKNNKETTEHMLSLVMEETTSILDSVLSESPAQYANEEETPNYKWEDVKTVLSDLDTSRLHYVRPPSNHIVLDFDIKNEEGKKDPALNLEAASNFPPTYSEFSKGGGGLHLHYIYDGDPEELASIYSEGIEIKKFTGLSSLRRKLSKCNNIPIAHIGSGLPLKEKKMINFETVKSEKSLRALIQKNLDKEVHPATKPSVDFIYKILEDAYHSELPYDISDMRPKVLAFANNSTNNSAYCIKLVSRMHFSSHSESESIENKTSEKNVFFDVEVFPNLFIVCWKYEGSDNVVRMINPKPYEIEDLIKMPLIGFNCRRYDNHILYARYMGYSNEELYKLSQKIINGSSNSYFGEAYRVSYADIYDFSSIRKSLKQWEIDLGINHKELSIPWDQQVSEELWDKVAEYCENDVRATEAVFKDRHEDFIARTLLSELSGLTVNDLTASHAAKIIFEGDRNPQKEFVYTDLSKQFEGYKYDLGTSSYRGENPGEGGYVYSEPGIYSNVALLDVASMHPTSIEALRLFGRYTNNFSALKQARLAIKHKDFKTLRHVLDGRLVKYLEDDSSLDALAHSLKIIINSIYGLTSAKFDNPFRDPRNKDNIVAKRGALFMIDLKHAVQEKGFTVAHIKTDSIKIPEATPEIIDFVMEFGRRYGYQFEHEATYEKMCLVNDAVYIAKDKKDGYWTATGKQFARPYVFKTLFSKEKITFNDYKESRSVQTALYLDLNEGLPEGEHNYQFVGKTGSFVPIKPGKGGGVLLRKSKEGKYASASDSKGYRWLESALVEELGRQGDIDPSFHERLVGEAIHTISNFGDYEMFVS